MVIAPLHLNGIRSHNGESIMHVVGGLYNEICLQPAWNGLFGSGGRAALAISTFSQDVTLHSYFEEEGSVRLDSYRDRGISLKLEDRAESLAFAYFHPLSTPYLQPTKPKENRPLQVEGRTVLRFGFVEGDAIVKAQRAVFDPQSGNNAQSFRSNGSSAEKLAVVLNELELTLGKKDEDILDAARDIIRRGQANVVVVKQGFKGATVVDELQRIFEIPSFKSPAVFKIGTGDVFSALFAHFWAEHELAPEIAAYKASECVASYATNRRLPLEHVATGLESVSGSAHGAVRVIGARDTLGSHYVFEEAKHRLRELGIDVQDNAFDGDGERPAAILVLAEGLESERIQSITSAESGTPIVLFDQRLTIGKLDIPIKVEPIRDFTTALYHAAWATMR